MIRDYEILKGPVTSEKSTRVADQEKSQIVMKVARSANKREIKQAVERIFKVNVLHVTVLNVKGKKKMFKGREGQRKNWKKAYVTLQAGQDIQFVGAE